MEWEIVMGLEVHTELATKTKIFCGCSTEFGGEPNTHVCEICSGMPGTLPLLNKRVVEFAVRTGIATNCTITQNNKFDRKKLFLPRSAESVSDIAALSAYLPQRFYRGQG